jgi:hypothetical protein
MRKLLIALIAAGFASATAGAFAADDKPYTSKPPIEKPGRAADDGSSAVKSGTKLDKPGRAADESTATPTDTGSKKKKGKKKKTHEPKQ